tara:strand:+ start:296 stop:613 length:318 start_codon:yes stop_codon:yes gene_type:complete
MLKEMNLGLVRMNEDNTQLLGAQYMLSKWERKLGDTLTIDGVKWRVGMIGDTKSDVIRELNLLIQKQNKIVRKQKYYQTKKENQVMNNLLQEVWLDLQKDLQIDA